MNLPTRLLLLGTLVLSPALFAADAFVGKVSFLNTPAKGKPAVMIQSMKGDFMRIETPDAPGAMLFNYAKMEMTILINEQHMYMVMPIKPSDAPPKEKAAAHAADQDVEVTGKTETILGYVCQQILVKDGKTTSELWLADGLGYFAGFNHSGGGGGMFGKKKGNAETAAKWEQVLKDKGGFPLRVIGRDAAGQETSRLEVTKIEKGGVTDADFQPPANFEKFAMPDMGGMNPFK